MRLATALAALVFLTIPLSAADWISLRSEHFQLYGNATERELRDVALRLEQFREAIGKLHPGSVPDSAPPVIALIFRDDRSFRPFMPRANGRVVPVTGVFTGGPDAAYIGLSLESGEVAYPGIYHEYSHYLLRGAFSAVPLWFNEGLAEYYSMFEVTNGGRSARIGSPHESHIALLRDRRLPLPRLFAITGGSAEYTRDVPDRIVLYAQSWLVVHHALHGEPRRRDQLIAFARRMAAGGELAASLRETYGISVTDLDRELQAYVRRSVFQYTNVDFTANVRTRLDARATPADEADLDARLGGLAAGTGNVDEAAGRLERALKAKPDAGYIHMSLSLVRTRQGRRDEANYHLQKARELGALPAPQFTVERRLSASELRAQFPEIAATLEASRPAVSPERAPIEVAPPREPRVKLLLHDLKDGERAMFGTLETIECRAAGIVVVLRTPQGVVRANAPSFSAVSFATFRSTTQQSIACGKQPPAPARLISRQEAASLVAVALELLPDGYVP